MENKVNTSSATTIYLCGADNILDQHKQLISELKQHFEVKNLDEHTEDGSPVMLFGGDGSLNYFVNLTYVKDKYFKVLYLPCGTANDFAKSLKIEPQVLSALAIKSVLLQGITLDIPTLKCNEQYFINVATAGSPANVTDTDKTLFKKVIGKFDYYLNAAGELFSAKPMSFTVTTDEQTHECNGYGFFVGQGLFAGGRMRVINSFVPCFNDKFCFLTVNSEVLVESMECMSTLQSQSVIDDNRALDLMATQFTVSSSEPIKVRLDGEEYESKKLAFKRGSQKHQFYLY